MADIQILERIKKLLTLANDTRGNEQEMQNAMAKAHALLSEHNLSMTDVDSIESNQTGSVKVDKNTFFESGLKIAMWKPLVWYNIAKLYYGAYWYGKTVNDINGVPTVGVRHTVIADPINAQVIKTMSIFVINQIEALSKNEPKGLGRSYYDSFKKGCASRVAERVRQLIADAKNNNIKSESGTSLVRLSDLYAKTGQAIQQYKIENRIHTKKTTSRAKCNSGYSRGKIAGDRVSLNRPLQ